jgi:hypothetical protein
MNKKILEKMIVEDSLYLASNEYDIPKRTGASISAFTIYDLSKACSTFISSIPFEIQSIFLMELIKIFIFHRRGAHFCK